MLYFYTDSCFFHTDSVLFFLATKSVFFLYTLVMSCFFLTLSSARDQETMFDLPPFNHVKRELPRSSLNGEDDCFIQV